MSTKDIDIYIDETLGQPQNPASEAITTASETNLGSGQDVDQTEVSGTGQAHDDSPYRDSRTYCFRGCR